MNWNVNVQLSLCKLMKIDTNENKWMKEQNVSYFVFKKKTYLSKVIKVVLPVDPFIMGIHQTFCLVHNVSDRRAFTKIEPAFKKLK